MNTETCKPYKPKLKRLGEKRALISLSNLEDWCEEMCLAFDRDVLNQNSSSNKTLHWLFNAYPLILAYQGKTQESELFLHRVITYWSDKFLQDKNNQNLINLIDPTINLLRLYKLTNKHSAFLKLMGEAAILDNTGKAKLGPISVNKEILGEQWNTLYVATLDETLKHYLLKSKYNEVLKLKETIPQYYREKNLYIEAEIVALISLERFENAMQLCWRQINKSTCIKSGVYSYRLYEAFKSMGLAVKAETVMKHLISNMEKTPLDSLSKLNFSSCIIEEKKLSIESLLVKKTLNQYENIKDEFNYGMTLCNLQSNHPTNKNKEKILKLYEKTDYKILKNRIEILFNIKNKKKPTSNVWLPKISNHLNEIIV
ncbi:hypothetical protein H5154_15175 [Pseudoalteromonas sp. SR44-5]|uniref:hypothetical protein n=1 Tax=unclassified Pseudoalteromonas TaxID=194690 RepID=UPI0016033321|nr:MULTISPECIES: hypothetical protein [unclassified Pseudoalteromonas]MBB1342539.1 hypothetical protein [Pseudoalteromonas sp. SR45-6]MBB1367724.1 hypothetical protein [Pseudoalteromonas sp. SR44-5]MBB1435388.1 hypothetical protein [Pseudoalteromonas sp. SG43-6]